MELKEMMKCPNCGQTLEIKDKEYQCNYCKSIFYNEEINQYNKTLEEVLGETFNIQKNEQIANARFNLYNELHKRFLSSEKIIYWCKEIKKNIPNDFQANFYETVNGNDINEINNAILSIDVKKHKVYIDDIIEFMLASLNEQNHILIEDLIEKSYTKKEEIEKKVRYLEILQNEIEKINKDTYVIDIPRDVFIAYSSKDIKEVNELVNYIEKEGLTCFIAQRNLRHGKKAIENYEEYIHKALKLAKSLVFVSTENSRSFECGAIEELTYVRDNLKEKKCYEYRLDTIETKSGMKKFLYDNEGIFKGKEWICDKEDLLNEIIKGIYNKKNDYQICKKCGAEIPLNANFCLKCGVNLKQEINDIQEKKPNEEKQITLINSNEKAGNILGNGTYKNKENVTIKATSNKHYKFLGWYNEQDLCVSNQVTYTFIIEESQTLIAKWDYVGPYIYYVVDGEIVYKGNYIEKDFYQHKTDKNFYGWYETKTFNSSNKKIDPSKLTITGDTYVYGTTLETKFEFEYKNDGYEITKYNDTKENVIIPSKINKIPVISIGRITFAFHNTLRNITIPNNITKIGTDAFSYCKSLKYNEYGNCLYLGNEENPYLVLVKAKDESITEATISNNTKFIMNNAFRYCRFLQNIAIPNSVIAMGYSAFYGCASLQSIFIPSNVKNIGERVFSSCYSLISIKVDENNRYYDSRDNCNAIIETSTNKLIKGCQTTIIPNSVITIDYSAFYGCIFLQSITIPSSVSSIGECVFSNCSSLTTIIVDKNNKYYDSRENCNAIIETSTNKLISGCQTTVIPSSVTSIGDYAFSSCTNLHSIIIPNDVTSIGEGAFSNCTYLQSIIIPNSVTSIGERAFSNCTYLQSITIPKSVTSIGEYAFSECSSLTIFCETSNQPNGWNQFWNYDNYPVHWNYKEKYDDEKLFIQEKKQVIKQITLINSNEKAGNILGNGTYKNKENVTIKAASNKHYKFLGWYNEQDLCVSNQATYTFIIEESQTLTAKWDYVGPYIYYVVDGEIVYKGNYIEKDFYQHKTDKNFYGWYETKTFNSSNKKIDLSKLTITGDIYVYGTTLETKFEFKYKNGGYEITKYNDAKENVIIPSIINKMPIISIGSFAFYHCNKLISVAFETNSKLKIIDGIAFANCSSLQSITIPSSVTNIGDNAFSHCSSLQSISIPNSIMSIGNDAFYGCSSLNYKESGNCLYLGNEENPYLVLVKAKDKSITEATISNNTKFIMNNAFRYCKSLQNIAIPNSVIAIGYSAFYGCIFLQSITIPSSVTSIGECVFSNCSSLTTIIVDENNKYYDSRDNCNAIIETSTNKLIRGCQTTIIPSSVIIIGENAFRDCTYLQSIIIPNSVTSIEEGAFFSCSMLTKITVDKNNKYYDSRENCNAIIETSTNKLIRGCQTTIIPCSVTSIGEGAFCGCSSLKCIIIPNSVTSIENNAFFCCNHLQSITIPNTVTNIGKFAFSYCCSLQSISIPNSIMSIGNETFIGCDSLNYNEYSNCLYLGNEENPYLVLVNAKNELITEATISNNTKFIMDNAFSKCNSLQSIIIPNSVTSIGECAFFECSSLTIFCETSNQPNGWNLLWNYDNYPVHWNYKKR